MDTPDTVKITFTETRIVDDERKGTFREERYEEGKTYELNARSADRWVKRAAAFFTSDEDAARAYGASRDTGNRLSDDTKEDSDESEAKLIDYAKLSRADLAKIAKERDLNVTGAKSKEDFIEILKAADAVPAPVDFSALSDDEIRAALNERGIDPATIASREDGVAKLEEAAATVPPAKAAE